MGSDLMVLYPSHSNIETYSNFIYILVAVQISREANFFVPSRRRSVPFFGFSKLCRFYYIIFPSSICINASLSIPTPAPILTLLSYLQVNRLSRTLLSGLNIGLRRQPIRPCNNSNLSRTSEATVDRFPPNRIPNFLRLRRRLTPSLRTISPHPLFLRQL